MQYREVSRPVVLFVLVFLLLCGGIASRTLSAKNEGNTQSPTAFASPSPSPSPRNREAVPQDSEQVITGDTNLTNTFSPPPDKNKRFISDLKAEDIRIFEDGQPQEVFTFQQKSDLPLSIAILIEDRKSVV